VPGLGTFAIIQRPAQINKVTRVITPPKMIIRFDHDPQADDGSLLGYLVRKLKQDTTDAEKAIAEFSAGIRDDIQKNGVSVLEGIGKLSRQSAGAVSFEPDEDLVKRISLFELPKINIPAPPPEKTAAPVAPAVIHKPVKRTRWWIPAIILLFVLIIGFLAPIYFTGNMDTLLGDLKGLITGVKKQPEKEKLVFGNPVHENSDTSQVSRELDEQVDRENALSIEQKENKAKPQPKQESPAVTAPVTSTVPETGKPYHIISGAFKVPENAEKHMAVLRQSGISAIILPKKGEYYMVSLGSYGSPVEAASAMKQFQEKVKNELWVMKK
jgi:cell division septation protein DedD